MSGFIKQEDIEAIRERTDLVEVASNYVALKKKGKYFWGLCPFHKEKTPSFKIDPVLQLYHCFGCGEGGNVFNFLMKIEKLEFPEVVETLAQKIGYKLQFLKVDQEKVSKRTRLLEIHEKALLFYQKILFSSAGQAALSYLKKRGFQERIIKAFGLGFAPADGKALFSYLTTKQRFSAEELLEAGLIIRQDQGFVDRFKKRIIFPIFDIRGRCIAFGGRVLDNSLPKYVNSPETDIYQKSKILYGLAQAKSEIVSKNEALVVEGYTDVIALHQSEVTNVVATLGTAFTSDHLTLLRRFTNRIVLVFDADTAGLKAAERGLEYISEFKLPGYDQIKDLVGERRGEVDLRVAILPQGKDPADLANEAGREAILALVASSKPFIDFYLERIVAKYDIEEVHGKEKAVSEGLSVILALDSAVSRDQYISKLAQLLAISTNSLYSELQKFKKSKGKVEVDTSFGLKSINAEVKAEEEFLKILLKFPEKRAKAFAEVDIDNLSREVHKRLAIVLKQQDKGKFQAEILSNLDSELTSLASRLLVEEVETEDIEKYFQDIITRLKEFSIQRQINRLRVKLEGMNPIKNKEEYNKLFESLIDLEARKRAIKEHLGGVVG
jgi:DNA primase